MRCSPWATEGATRSQGGSDKCDMAECGILWLSLLVLSLALLASLCLNLKFCLLRRKRPAQSKDQNASRYSLTQNEEAYPGETNNYAEENGIHLQQENPIYGNIVTKDTGSVVYEAMAVRARSRIEPAESDLNYASLDLKLAKKRKRWQQQGHVPGRGSPPDQLQDRLTPPLLLEGVDVCLPLRDHSPMVSHSSIYLNSQQIDLEREDNDTMHWLKSGEQRDLECNPEQQSQDEDGSEECSNDRRSTDEHDMQDDTGHISADVNQQL